MGILMVTDNFLTEDYEHLADIIKRQSMTISTLMVKLKEVSEENVILHDVVERLKRTSNEEEVE